VSSQDDVIVILGDGGLAAPPLGDALVEVGSSVIRRATALLARRHQIPLTTFISLTTRSTRSYAAATIECLTIASTLKNHSLIWINSATIAAYNISSSIIHEQSTRPTLTAIPNFNVHKQILREEYEE